MKPIEIIEGHWMHYEDYKTEEDFRNMRHQEWTEQEKEASKLLDGLIEKYKDELDMVYKNSIITREFSYSIDEKGNLTATNYYKLI